VIAKVRSEAAIWRQIFGGAMVRKKSVEHLDFKEV